MSKISPKKHVKNGPLPRNTARSPSRDKKPASSGLVYEKDAATMSRDSADGSVGILVMDDLMSFYRIDGWAAHLWKHIDGKTTFEKIRAKIQKKSALKPEFIMRESKKTIDQLVKHGLIKKMSR